VDQQLLGTTIENLVAEGTLGPGKKDKSVPLQAWTGPEGS